MNHSVRGRDPVSDEPRNRWEGGQTKKRSVENSLVDRQVQDLWECAILLGSLDIQHFHVIFSSNTGMRLVPPIFTLLALKLILLFFHIYCSSRA